MTKFNAGSHTDKVYRLRERYYELKKKADQAEAVYKEELQRVYQYCIREGTSQVRGSVSIFSYTPELVPTLEDPLAFFKFCARNKAWDLLYKAVNSTAYRERLDAHMVQGRIETNNKKISGVKPFIRDKFSLRKRN